MRSIGSLLISVTGTHGSPCHWLYGAIHNVVAARLRKRPDYIVSAPSALLKEQKVECTPVTGYWRLNA
jgi:hypothetical protein